MKLTTVDDLTAERLHLFLPLDRDRLEQAQMKELRRTVDYAWQNSPLYNKRFSAVKLQSNLLVERADLEKLPLITSEDIVEKGHLLQCVSQSVVARIITMYTSGSTGKPKRFCFTQTDLAATREFFSRGMASFVGKTDRVLVLLPFETEASVGDLLITTLIDGGIAAEGFWPPMDFSTVTEQIVKKKITSLVGLPQHLLTVSYCVPHGQIKTMLLCSDYAPESLRSKIEKNCGCETFLHYGATESGLGGAVECSAHCGVHIREGDLLVEIIDPETRKKVPDGKVGEIVLTTLGRQAMPLIRYRTGDRASLLRERCHCGGVTARLCNIYGRSQGAVLADGTILRSHVLDDLLFQVPGLLDYRATLDNRDVDRLSFEYVADSRIKTVESDMRRLLFETLEISDLLKSGDVLLENIQQVQSFAPTHTLKRTILDLR